jgi:hypothetical protein
VHNSGHIRGGLWALYQVRLNAVLPARSFARLAFKEGYRYYSSSTSAAKPPRLRQPQAINSCGKPQLKMCKAGSFGRPHVPAASGKKRPWFTSYRQLRSRRYADCHSQVVPEGAGDSSRNRSCSNPEAMAALTTTGKQKRKGQPDFSDWPFLMPAHEHLKLVHRTYAARRTCLARGFTDRSPISVSLASAAFSSFSVCSRRVAASPYPSWRAKDASDP